MKIKIVKGQFSIKKQTDVCSNNNFYHLAIIIYKPTTLNLQSMFNHHKFSQNLMKFSTRNTISKKLNEKLKNKTKLVAIYNYKLKKAKQLIT